MRQHTIITVGEVLWDMFPSGPRFGGAPANLACHAAMLGANVTVVSRVGEDDFGRQAIQFLKSAGINPASIQVDPVHATGSVLVTLDGAGKPTFAIRRDVAWDHLEWHDHLASLAEQADAICFGTLAQRCNQTRSVITRLLTEAPDRLRLLDLNLRPPFFDEPTIRGSLAQANALKLNDEELETVRDLLHLVGSPRDQIEQLRQQFDLRLIALTRGHAGSLLVVGDQQSELIGRQLEVVDTVGAGDAFTAAVVVGYLNGKPLPEFHVAAAALAEYVCCQAGAVPKLPAALVNQVVAVG